MAKQETLLNGWTVSPSGADRGALELFPQLRGRSQGPSSIVKTSKHQAEREGCLRSSHRAYLMSFSMVSRAVGIFTSVM
jgi:hypothetical protein